MAFLSVSGQHFMSYRERFTLSLADQGVVLIRGENRVSQAADSNGVGKTGLISALRYGCYGLTLKGLRGDDVACRFTKDPCRVEVVGEDPRGRWMAARGRRPKLFDVSEWGGAGWRQVLADQDDAVKQRWLDGRIGYSDRTFRNAVVFDAIERYASLEPAEQLRLLDEVQGINFRAALQRAKDWRQGLELEATGAAADAARAAERVDDLLARLAELEAAQAAHEADVAARRRELARQRREALELARAKEAELAAIRAARRELAKKQQLLELATAAADAVAEAEGEVRLAQQRVAQADAGRVQLDDRLNLLVHEGRCLACHQAIPGRQDLERGFARELAAVHVAVEGSRKDLARAERTLRRKQATLDEYTGHGDLKLADLREQVDALRDASSRAAEDGAREAVAHAAALAEDAAAAQAALSAAWPMLGSLRQARDDLRAAKRDRVAAQEREARARRHRRLADYWVEAFGDRGIRSLLFDQVGAFITERAAEHLAQLAGGEAATVVSALSALKSGATKERLSITTDWAWGAAGDAGSTGQDQRVALAIFAALQDVAESWAAHPFSVKFFDEAADGLDQRGKELFVEWVRGQARRHGTVALITHDALLAGTVDADTTWTVVLDRDGSHVEVTE